ncbi:hypothetical protein FQA39_LY19346 [Lamprigera yunnana]|nr:hypothetical protein FQA39_LY19346 [Lamprigera yunnana]
MNVHSKEAHQSGEIVNDMDDFVSEKDRIVELLKNRGLIRNAYGNADFIPFSKEVYTGGGANDMRAWVAATLGPADIPGRFDGEKTFFCDFQYAITLERGI